MPTHTTSGGGGEDSDKSAVGKLLSRIPELQEFVNNTTTKGAAAVAAFGAALASQGDLTTDQVAAFARGSTTGASSPGGIAEFLATFASAPVTFIWNLIFQRLLEFAFTIVLYVIRSVVDVILLILAGDSLALQTEGRLGLSDLIFAVFVTAGGAMAQFVAVYYETLIGFTESLSPSTGTALDGVVAVLVFATTLSVTLWLGYRLAIAIMDALPGLSGVQTFITGGS